MSVNYHFCLWNVFFSLSKYTKHLQLIINAKVHCASKYLEYLGMYNSAFVLQFFDISFFFLFTWRNLLIGLGGASRVRFPPKQVLDYMIHGCLIKREKKVKVTYFHSRNSWGMRGNFKNLPQVCLMYCILLTTLHKITILELSSEVVGLFQRNIWIVMLSMVFCDQNCSDQPW